MRARVGGVVRLVKDLLSIVFFAIAEVFERLGFACQDKGLEPEAQRILREAIQN